ncbi:uncharacterized protein LOC108676646 [Hyalella azteca]|uniref:Uncharacterized protein LOC108676646 n=1 Tax=Hyalella azteca TaxID=294128 RepID=A0A979FTN8_HYAAZ|nr:uncharacterized protein LOC108676646 [Hyalella azteca]
MKKKHFFQALLVHLLLLSFLDTTAASEHQLLGLENSPLTEVTAVVGGDASLPCPIHPHPPDDAPIMVLFYRGGGGTPIYTVDGRSTPLPHAHHWQDSSLLNSGAHFNTAKEGPALVLRAVRRTDQGLYRCRVDFRRSRSRNFRMKLDILNKHLQQSGLVPFLQSASRHLHSTEKAVLKVLPESMRAVDRDSVLQDLSAAFDTADHATLLRRLDVSFGLHGTVLRLIESYLSNIFQCARRGNSSSTPSLVTCGVPQGSVIDPILFLLYTVDVLRIIDSHVPPRSASVVQASGSAVASGVVGPHREGDIVALRCEVHGVPPVTGRLSGLESPLQEGVVREVVCEGAGSRPPASITWRWNDAPMEHSPHQDIRISYKNFADGNVSQSILTIVPKKSDEGAKVSCRVDNARLPLSTIEDHGTITVHYVPQLQVEAGQNMDLTDIKEGADVYFECSIQANPVTDRLTWLHNGRELHHNLSAGILMSHQSLVLQKLRRNSTGEYVCSATNVIGTGRSEPIVLVVQYAPVCRHAESDVQVAGRLDSLNVSCDVDAFPPPTSFRCKLCRK